MTKSKWDLAVPEATMETPVPMLQVSERGRLSNGEYPKLGDAIDGIVIAVGSSEPDGGCQRSPIPDGSPHRTDWTLGSDTLAPPGESLSKMVPVDRSADEFAKTAQNDIRVGDESQEYVVNVDRSAGGKLGIRIDDADGEKLVVMMITAPGLIADWNGLSSATEVWVGDCIIDVNGIRGKADAMYEECMKLQVLCLTLRRAQVPCMQKALPTLACPTDSAEVLVHAYDLWGHSSRLPRLVNAGSTRFGLFHTGIEVYGREWYFCGTDSQFHGVYCMPEPRNHPVHRYCKTVSLGQTQLSRQDLEQLMPDIREKWFGRSYHPLRRNCHYFTDFMCKVLGFPCGPKFGLYAVGDLSLADQRIGVGGCGSGPCFPCTSVRFFRNYSRPLLSQSGNDTDAPDTPSAISPLAAPVPRQMSRLDVYDDRFGPEPAS